MIALFRHSAVVMITRAIRFGIQKTPPPTTRAGRREFPMSEHTEAKIGRWLFLRFWEYEQLLIAQKERDILLEACKEARDQLNAPLTYPEERAFDTLHTAIIRVEGEDDAT
jgi:hypothetical protein